MMPLLALLGVGMHAAWKRGLLASYKTRLFAVAGTRGRRRDPHRRRRLRRYPADDDDRLCARAVGHVVLAPHPARAPAREAADCPPRSSGWSSRTSASGWRRSASPACNRSRSKRMSPSRSGRPRRSAGYDFKFAAMRDVRGPNYVGVEADVVVSHGGSPVTILHPQKRLYNSGGNAMTEAGIEVGAARDLFAALGDELGQGRWSLRLQYKPLIRYIWLGAILIALGGAIAAHRPPLSRARRGARRPGDRAGCRDEVSAALPGARGRLRGAGRILRRGTASAIPAPFRLR